MREIEFRGKDIVSGKWRHGHYFELGADNHSYIKAFSESTRDLMHSFIVDKKTVGQYTGLKDADGKKIFEGDILECDTEGYPREIKRGVVEYFIDGFSVAAKGDLRHFLYLDPNFKGSAKWCILGNIHEWKLMIFTTDFCDAAK